MFHKNSLLRRRCLSLFSLVFVASLSLLGETGFAQDAPDTADPPSANSPAAADPVVQEAVVDQQENLNKGAGWANEEVLSIEYVFWAILLASSILALVFAYRFFKQVKAADPGNDRMVEIADYVTLGAKAYLKQQYIIVSIYFVVVFLLLLVARWAGIQQYWVPIAFLT